MDFGTQLRPTSPRRGAIKSPLPSRKDKPQDTKKEVVDKNKSVLTPQPKKRYVFQCAISWHIHLANTTIVNS